jgi:hypothetical protein
MQEQHPLTCPAPNRPDLCDGTSNEYCDMTPPYTNITSILRHYGQDDLLEFMNRYWLAASSVPIPMPIPIPLQPTHPIQAP